MPKRHGLPAIVVMTFVETVWRCAMVLLLVAATAAMVEAQELASSFDQLRVLVKPGEVVSVTDGTGQEVKGTIASMSSASLELMVEGNRRTFLEGDIRTIRRRQSDSLKNGALWGLGVGVGFALLGAAGASDDSGGLALFGALIYGGIGVAVGVGVDAMVRSTGVIYSRPAGSSARLTVSPLLARDRKGLLLSLGF